MTAQNPPATDTKISFDGKTPEELKDIASKFSQALDKSGLKAAELFNTTPQTVTIDNETIVEKWMPIYTTAKKTLEDAGVKFDAPADLDPVSAKFSEMKKEVDTQLERFSEAKFGEQSATLKSIYQDFPVDSISKLSVSWNTKVEIGNAMLGVAHHIKSTVSKLQGEIDNLTKELKDVKSFVPVQETRGDGIEIIKKQMAKFGIEKLSGVNTPAAGIGKQ